MTAQRTQLPGGRWHFEHGPIDLIVSAAGDAQAVGFAHAQAWQRFTIILQELVDELPALRSPVRGVCPVQGPIAQRMWLACKPYQHGFITPMAAVAGAVAQELVSLYQTHGIERAWINNGGDIAIHLAAGQTLSLGLYANLARFDAAQLYGGITLDGHFEIVSESAVRGVATSGWRGRSFSLGIADSVTVFAATAAAADAAATVIANAVNVDDARISRRPACAIKDSSDLGSKLVTVGVPPMPPELIERALAAGLACASTLKAQGLICSAVLVCQNQYTATDAAQPVAPRPVAVDHCRAEFA